MIFVKSRKEKQNQNGLTSLRLLKSASAFAGMTRVVGFLHFLKFESAHRHLDKAPTDLTTKCHDTWAKLRAPVTRGMDGTAHQQRYCPCGFIIAR